MLPKQLEMPYLYALGNHDWTYPWEYFSEKAKEEYRPLFTQFCGNQTDCSMMEFEELVVVAIDNSRDQIEEGALQPLREILAKNKPTIIIMHVPLSTFAVEEQSEIDWGRSITIGGKGIIPNEHTRAFLDMINAENSPVSAILSGHVHFPSHEDMNQRFVQIIADDAFSGEGVLLTVG